MSAKKVFTLITLLLLVSIELSCARFWNRNKAGRLVFTTDLKPAKGRSAKKSLVIVTHGWLDKGRGGWPEDMALAIEKRIDSNDWLCGCFDWTGEAITINPADAAQHAKDTAGPRLGREILKLGSSFEHIHLIAHSSGCWAISEAAKIVAEQTKADIHVTFFDAYVPILWDESKLGDVNTAADVNCWIEHYYTRDYTLGLTQQDLSNAHNVDITNIDHLLKDHHFPWRWYYATITGRYPKGSFLDNSKLVLIADGIEYGFARSREADPNSWNESLKLPSGNKAVKFKKPKKPILITTY